MTQLLVACGDHDAYDRVCQSLKEATLRIDAAV